MKRFFSAQIILLVVFITLLHSCNNTHESSSEPASQLYAYAVKSLHCGQQNEAELSLKKCLSLYKDNGTLKNMPDSTRQLFPQVLVQLLNTYKSEGQPETCVAYFDSLRSYVDAPQHQRSWLSQHYRRDVYVVLAYALSRTEDTERAARVMTQALQMKLSDATPERKFRDYAYAAAVYFCEPSYHQQVDTYGQKALVEAEKCSNKAGAGWLASMLGSWYARTGRVHDAVDMYNQGYLFSQQMNDTLGMVNARIYQADCMLQWNMPHEAEKYAASVVEMLSHSLNFNPQVTAQAYIVMARSLAAQQRTREAMRYINQANRLCMSLPYNSGNSDLDVLMGSIGVRNEPSQSANYKQAEEKLQRAAHGATPSIKARAWYELARTHLATQRKAQAEQELDSLYAALRVLPQSVFLSNAYDLALKHYIEVNNKEKIVQYATAVNKLRTDSTFKRTTQSIAQVMVDINNETQQQMHDGVIVKLKRWAWGGYLLSFVLLLMLVATIIAFKRSKVKQQRDEKSLQLQLADVKQHLRNVSTNKDVLERKLQSAEQETANNVKEGVQLVEILQKKGETKFREYFERAYPYFIRQLRQHVPDITRKEELFCIVIALGCDNNDMMEMFNIARQSVHMAKYRVRKKMNLADGISIEDFLKQLLQSVEAK